MKRALLALTLVGCTSAKKIQRLHLESPVDTKLCPGIIVPLSVRADLKGGKSRSTSGPLRWKLFDVRIDG